jgi:intracellular multiplication protein IcmP
VADQKSSSHDGAIGWFILGVIFILLMMLLWHFQQHNIRNAWRWIHYGQMVVASVFIDENKFTTLIPNPQGVDRPPVEISMAYMLEQVPKIPKENLDGRMMDLISYFALDPYKYVFTSILAILAFMALFTGPKSSYRKRLDLNLLIKRQANNFPYIAPFVTFNPGDQPPRPPGAPVPAELPAFAEALGPEEWISYNEVPVPDGKVDVDAATRAFAKQLGGPWRGALELAPYKQVLLAAFILKALRKRSEADDLLGQLSLSWSHDHGLRISGKLLSSARRVLKDKDKSARVINKCNQHAFENTALLRALATAREEGGVLAPAQFVWLRGFDRTLWYPLNNLGRQSFHMEALGAICHYKAEKQVQRPIPRPKVDDAVKSLIEHISSQNARPIPTLDYSKSKKRGIKKVKGSA